GRGTTDISTGHIAPRSDRRSAQQDHVGEPQVSAERTDSGWRVLPAEERQKNHPRIHFDRRSERRRRAGEAAGETGTSPERKSELDSIQQGGWPALGAPD